MSVEIANNTMAAGAGAVGAGAGRSRSIFRENRDGRRAGPCFDPMVMGTSRPRCDQVLGLHTLIRQPPSPPTCTPRERAHQHTLHTHASVVACKCVDRGPCAGPEGNLWLELSADCGRCGEVICRCKCIFRANLTAARLRSLAPLLRYSFAPFFFSLLA